MRQKLSLILILIVLLTSCVNVVNIKECLPMEEPSGFWSGTLDGMIMGPSFICSIIWDDIAIYDVNNNGVWYNFGFVGGFFTILKLIGFGRKKMNKE
jgi:hypothetical protein